MKTYTLDFETYYDADGYSLSKMTNEEYVRDPRFEALCLAVKPFGEEGFVLKDRHDITYWLWHQSWDEIAVIMHHAHFDGFILSEKFDVRPAFYFDTLSMARAVHGPLEKASLEDVSRRYGLEPKSVPYNRFRGRRWADMDEALRKELCDGCLHDAELTETIFRKLSEGFPKEELQVIDLTVRMYTEPRVLGDAPLFARLAKEEQERKERLLEEIFGPFSSNPFERQEDIGRAHSHLQSSATLVRILSELGETVPVKPGKLTPDGKPGKPIPCFAANDDYMLDNCDRDDQVGKILRARLDVKSTLAETRSGRLAAMSERGPLPIYHKYWAATTGRWGGGEKVNIQNLPRDGEIRSGLMAPEGHSFVIVDFTSIEYMILCALAGQKDMLAVLAAGYKPYCLFGEELFHQPIAKGPTPEYNFSKMVVLGCGFGTGKEKLAGTAKARGFTFERKLTDRAVDTYRRLHKQVVTLWKRCDNVLPALANGQTCHLTGTPLRFADKCLILPNGMRCRFDLVWCDETQGWFRRTSRSPHTPEKGDGVNALLSKGYTPYWGGGLTEFVCQALARIRLSELIIKARERYNFAPVFLVHDEFVALVRDEDHPKRALEVLVELAKKPSNWWPDGPPFSGEGHVVKRYGK